MNFKISFKLCIIITCDCFSKKGKKEGTVEVQEARIEIVPTFLDYIKVGKVRGF